jgi:hypothetical protein
MTEPQDPAAAGSDRLRAGHADREQAIEARLGEATARQEATADHDLVPPAPAPARPAPTDGLTSHGRTGRRLPGEVLRYHAEYGRSGTPRNGQPQLAARSVLRALL